MNIRKIDGHQTAVFELMRQFNGTDMRGLGPTFYMAARVDDLLPDRGRTTVWPFLGHLLDLPLDDDAARVVTPFTRSTAGSIQGPIANAFAEYLAASAAAAPLVLQ